MLKTSRIIGGAIIAASAAVAITGMVNWKRDTKNAEASAKVQLRDSLDLTTQEYSKLLAKDCFNSSLDKVGSAKIQELSPTPKVYDSAMTLVNSGRQTYATVYNNMKKAAKSVVKK